MDDKTILILAASGFALLFIFAMSKMGWNDLLEHYRAPEGMDGQDVDPHGGFFKSTVIHLYKGKAHSKFPARVRANQLGMHLSTFFPQKYINPPLIIPWSEIEEKTTEHNLLSFKTKNTHLHFRNAPNISIMFSSGLLEELEAASQGQWKRKIISP